MRIALALACAVVAILVFLPTLGHAFVDWDDTGVLLETTEWRGLGAEQLQWMFTTNHYGHYQPVTWLTYGLDYTIWGMNPRGYHLTNVLFHAANALLVWFLAHALIGTALRTVRETHRHGPWLIALAATGAALVFATHPLRVESVAWVTQRRDLVSAFFILLTMLAYLRSTTLDGRARVIWLGVALGVYVLSMLSKVGGAPLPLVLLVIDWYPLRRVDINPLRWWRLESIFVVLEKVPFLVVAMGFAFATIHQQSGRWLIPLEQHDLVARTAQAAYGLVFYVWKTIAPVGLSPLYELRFPLDPQETRFIVCASIVVTALAAIAFWWRKWPAVTAVVAAYVLMIGPLLGFFQNGPQIVADRYSYLSTLGWILLLAGGGAALIARREQRTLHMLVGAAAAAVVITTSVLTVRQARVWQDTASLWSSVVEHEPDSAYGNNSYGYVLLQAGDIEAAEAHIRTSLEISRRHAIDVQYNEEALYNLIEVLQAKGVDDTAAYEAALAYNPRHPNLWYGLGNACLAAQRNEAAVEAYRQAIDLNSNDPRFHTNLGIALARLEQFGAARVHLTTAARLDPTLWNARDNLARVYMLEGNYAQARRVLRELLRDNPGYGSALSRMQWLDENHPE